MLTGGLAEQVGDVVGVGSDRGDGLGHRQVAGAAARRAASCSRCSTGPRRTCKQPGFRWVTPGGLLAVVIWVVASAAFAFYVANFGSYNKTYGALGGVIVFLVWLWISNIAMLLGAELNAELERERAIEAGMPADEEPYVEPRDTRKLENRELDVRSTSGRDVHDRHAERAEDGLYHGLRGAARAPAVQVLRRVRGRS